MYSKKNKDFGKYRFKKGDNMEFSRKKYLDHLISKMNNSLIKVITGARRSGKSYFLNQIFYSYLKQQGINDKNIIRFAFDNDEDIDKIDSFFPEEPAKIPDKNGLYYINSKKFRAYIKSITSENETYYLLLDEIQILDSFVGTLNSFLNHRNFDVYVTGSNSQLLSSEIETKFRGRKSSIHMLPLSFSEFMTGFHLDSLSAWKKYIVTGGIPIVYKQSDDDKFPYLNELCNEVYLKDIIGRKGVKEKGTLSDLFSVLASCIGTPVSPSSLEKAFKSKKNVRVSNDTIDTYISHFEDSFVVSKAKKYNIKGKSYINTPYKVYFEDIGVRNARTGFKQIEETHILENIVYNELRYRGYSVDIGEIDVNEPTDRFDCNNKKIYAKKSLEVDFIATKANEKYYIQVCLNMNSNEVAMREKRSLYYIHDSFQKIIITKDGLPKRIDENGVILIDIFDFLLNENLL